MKRSKESMVAFLACLLVLGISGSTVLRTVSSFRNEQTETNEIMENHKLEQNQLARDQNAGDNDSDDSTDSFAEKFTQNLVGKEQGARIASEVAQRISGDTYIESNQVLLGKEGWLFYKDENDGYPLADYQGTHKFSKDHMASIAEKLEKEKEAINAKGCDFYILSIPDKSTLYGEYMADTVSVASDTCRTDQLMTYLQKHSSLSVINARDYLEPYKSDYDLYFRTDTHFNNIGSFLTCQALIKEISGKCDTPDTVRFEVYYINHIGDLAILCNMEDTFNYDTYYIIDESTVDPSMYVDKSILLVGDSFSNLMPEMLQYYCREVNTVSVWKFTTDDIDKYHADIVVWEGVGRYTERFDWISLLD